MSIPPGGSLQRYGSEARTIAADVKVSVDEKTTKPYDLNETDGLLTWKVKLAPSEKRELVIGFNVDVPDSYELGGL